MSEEGWTSHENAPAEQLADGTWQVRYEPMGLTAVGPTRPEAYRAFLAAFGEALAALPDDERAAWVAANMSFGELPEAEACALEPEDG